MGQEQDHAAGHQSHSHAGHSLGTGSHSHAPADFGRAFIIGISLNIAYVFAEAIFGFLTNSMALLADAGHNLSDVLGLVVAWVGAVLSRRPPTPRFTFGLRGSSILAALFNSMLLLVAVGAMAWEAIQRLMFPEPVASLTVSIVAAIGILVNGGTALLFASGRKTDLNIKGAYLHMAADAAVSLAVVVAGIIITFTGWIWLDPVTSLIISAVIVAGTWGLLRDSTVMSLNAVPPGIDPAAVRAFLESQPGVNGVHDLHIWPLGTTDIALTCHLLMPDGHPGDRFLIDLSHNIGDRFHIHHATVQIESDPVTVCSLAPEHVV